MDTRMSAVRHADPEGAAVGAVGMPEMWLDRNMTGLALQTVLTVDKPPRCPRLNCHAALAWDDALRVWRCPVCGYRDRRAR